MPEGYKTRQKEIVPETTEFRFTHKEAVDILCKALGIKITDDFAEIAWYQRPRGPPDNQDNSHLKFTVDGPIKYAKNSPVKPKREPKD